MGVLESIALVNAVLALISFITLQWAIPKVGRPLNWILTIASMLALFYSGAYFWLGFNIEHVVGWSNFLRWFGLLTWPIVWAAPPVAMVSYIRRTSAQLTTALHPNQIRKGRSE